MKEALVILAVVVVVYMVVEAAWYFRGRIELKRQGEVRRVDE